MVQSGVPLIRGAPLFHSLTKVHTMPMLRVAKRKRRAAMANPKGNDLRAAKLKAMKRRKAKWLRGL